MHFGITGHRGLDDQLQQRIAELLAHALAPHAQDLTGISCLADGPDSTFADLVLALGGRLEAVIPARGYRDGLPDWHHATYDRLLAAAADVHETGLPDSTPQAHMVASEMLVGLSDLLIAVWDGRPARGYGGTADVVAYAHAVGTPVLVVWPEGAVRPEA
ncbi:hypothetical protein ACIQF6_28315 [Kitasatospora sp. NPDC092948]|uniref:hypothetical protein n=1 Tax=Kitasatospora sp. NPDC092948 TaxID=3364088 RepID=UPI0038057A17